MAIKKAIKKQLKTKEVAEAKTHAKVVHKKDRKENVIKNEEPLDHTNKHQLPYTKSNKVVGMNLGVTRNMENYESLRVDVWCTDEVQENETFEDALDRISGLVKSRLDYEIEDIIGE